MSIIAALWGFSISTPLPDEEPTSFVRNERQALARRRQLLAQRAHGIKDQIDENCEQKIFYNEQEIRNASLNVRVDCEIVDRSCRRKCKKETVNANRICYHKFPL